MKKTFSVILVLIFLCSIILCILNWPQIYPVLDIDEILLNYRVVGCNVVSDSEQNYYIKQFDSELNFEGYSVCELVIEIENNNKTPVNYVRIREVDDVIFDGKNIDFISEKNVYLNSNFKCETILNEEETYLMTIILLVETPTYELITSDFNLCEFEIYVCGKNANSFLNIA